MNVRLAAQTPSDSVADTLSYLKNQYDLFSDVEPTAEFIRYINNVFDILNSRSKFSINPYNKAIPSDINTSRPVTASPVIGCLFCLQTMIYSFFYSNSIVK